MELNIGSRIGDYEVIDILGAGGMGKVFKVRNNLSDRVEAMKVLLPNLAANPELADRFMREIKLQASLEHPNIAQLHTALHVDNQLLMLMEFVDGVSLERKLKAGPLPVPQAVDAIAQVLTALEFAHSRGVVHRDVKPANIMMTPSGLVKLMDFGIAKGANDRQLTMTGVTMGSLYYMSPEQIQGASGIDARADLYSVGVTLYELVTGKRPFDGDSQFSIMSAHLEKAPVPPIQLDPNVPQMLNDIILLAVAKDPNARFQGAGAMRTALSNVLPPGALPTPQPATAGQPARIPTNPAFGASPSAPPPPVYSQPPVGPPSGSYQPAMPPPPPPQAPMMMPPPPMPQPMPTQRTGGNRGLWMAVGALAAVAAAGAVIYIAPWKASSKSQDTQQTQNRPAPPQPEHAAAPPPSPIPQEQAAPAPALPAQSPSTRTPPVQSASASAGAAPVPNNDNFVPPKPKPPQVADTKPPRPNPNVVPPPNPDPVVNPTPQPPPPTPAPQPQPVGPSRAEIQTMREHLVKLGARANGIQGSLNSLERSQQSMGMSLSSKFTGPRDLMNSYMQGAQDALNGNDLESAKDLSTKAERQIEILEKLLNR